VTAEPRARLLPVYVLADESHSMGRHVVELNRGLSQLHEALLSQPMAAAKVRFSIIGFSDDVKVRMSLADLRHTDRLPRLISRGRTHYGKAFADLRRRLPADVRRLKAQGFAVHRPAVFMLTDGQPNDTRWREQHRRLIDHEVTPGAPNVIACGVGSAHPETILELATRREFAFVALGGVDIGVAIADFCTALTHSIIRSAPARSAGPARLVVEQPAGFEMAIDVV
jgi:uncharacterized protein YegL